MNIAGSLRKMKLVPSAFSFLSSVLLRCHLVTPRPYSTLKFRGFFLRSGSACDLPTLRDNTACKALEEIRALTESVRAIAALPPHCIFNPFPCCAGLGEGLREVLLIGVGVFVWKLFWFYPQKSYSLCNLLSFNTSFILTLSV